MSRAWETKERIIESLKQKSKTLTDLSEELELAPSTVSQHLHELCRLGRISETNLSMSKKWKYYEVNRAVASPIEEQNRLAFQDNRLLWAVIATVLVLGALFFVYSSKPGITTQSVGGSRTAGQALSPPSNIPVKNGTTVFSISDSPQSYDISGVYVNISNVSVRNAATGNFYVLPLATSRFDLMALANVSQVLANVTIPAGMYDMVMLNISNAYVTVNGMNESVTIPKKAILLNVSFNISNATTNWINMDIDLQESLHVTCMGRVVLLPVVTTTYYSHAGLALTSEKLVMVQKAGSVVKSGRFDMSLNGTMMANFTEYENASMDVNVTTGTITMNKSAVGNGVWTRNGSSIIVVTGSV